MWPFFHKILSFLKRLTEHFRHASHVKKSEKTGKRIEKLKNTRCVYTCVYKETGLYETTIAFVDQPIKIMQYVLNMVRNRRFLSSCHLFHFFWINNEMHWGYIKVACVFNKKLGFMDLFFYDLLILINPFMHNVVKWPNVL